VKVLLLAQDPPYRGPRGPARVPPRFECQPSFRSQEWDSSHCTLAGLGPGFRFYFQSPLHTARSIHGADYAISDNACCPSRQARSQNRLRVSGAPIIIPAGLSVHACPSECWSSRSSRTGLGLDFLSRTTCLSIIFGGACATGAAGAWGWTALAGE